MSAQPISPGPQADVETNDVFKLNARIQNLLDSADSAIQDEQVNASASTVPESLARIMRPAKVDRNLRLKMIAEEMRSQIRADLVLLANLEMSQEKPTLFRLAGVPSNDIKAVYPIVRKAVTQACEARRLTVVSQNESIAYTIAAIPLSQNKHECLVVVGSETPSAAHALVVAGQSIEARLSAFDSQQSVNESNVRLERVAAVTDLVSRLESAEEPTSACRQLAELLAEYFPGTRVFVGLNRDHKNSCRLVAASGQVGIERQNNESRLIENALREVIERGEAASWPPRSDSRHALLAHKRLSMHFLERPLTSLAMRQQDQNAVGAVLVVAEDDEQQSWVAEFLGAAEKPVARSLGLLTRVRRNRLGHALNILANSLKRRKGMMVVGALIVLCALMAVPFPYSIRAKCELQPVSRRYVSAPFETKLQESLVEPGDVVQANQIIAQLDGREMELELAEIEAQRKQASKEHAGYLARHETGEAEIARLEIERLEQRVELLQHRMDSLQIRSPLGGVVISGDLSRSEGTPLEKGQALYEIAPLDSIVVELAIPEQDLRFVEVGTEYQFRLDAFPDEVWNGRVERIHPRAELRAHENVFIAEVSIPNGNRRLRPGMCGHASLDGGWHPLGWNLFHRAFYAAQVWVGW